MIEGILYQVDTLTSKEGEVRAALIVDKDSPALKGHFPGQPILPGMYLLQMVKQVFSRVLERPIFMPRAKEMKFIKLISCSSDANIEIVISYSFNEERQCWPCKVDVLFHAELYSRFRCEFIASSTEKNG